ncbi:hypothetical protein D7X74_01805 [Corallococcus sp. CA047B]|uniref:hypothetical protein n=1 Tax=Corallococcus sp. CA047B TaxID=2316729 RepID=UPI000EA01578|nr:hypothetical protein [Corallococcus sp. CA047B]RKH21148.1 hypothetical protein D7X74_01805 [Corallococcus sp. CA047B]
MTDTATTRVRWRRASLAGWLAFALCGVTAGVRAATVAPAPERKHLSDVERVQVGRAAAAEEPMWRAQSLHNFPGDHWSQDDDFSAAERSWVMGEAQRRDVPVEEVFRAIDEELHSSSPVQPPRKATAAPCKPRAFYD